MAVSLISRRDLQNMANDIRYVSKKVDAMHKAIDELLDSEDNTGCDGDLTVVSMKAIEKVEAPK